MITIDGNGAVASVAFRTSEVIAIYPITPSSTMAEQADAWAGNGLKTSGETHHAWLKCSRKRVLIATVHGALQTGALSTSFTSSQGLLLMIPTLYKLAGELTPFVLHVAARTVATHALSILAIIPTLWRCARRVARCCVQQTSRKRKTLLLFRTSRR